MMTDTYTKPLPGTEEVWAPHWAAAANHELHVQFCPSCDLYQFPPLTVCSNCAGSIEWKEVSGHATIHTFIIIHQVYHPGFVDDVPYNVTVVELDEGPFLVTNLVEIANDEIQIGMKVAVSYVDISDGITLAKFRPAQEA